MWYRVCCDNCTLTQLICAGEQSCQYCIITSVANIDANGNDVLSNTAILSQANGIMIVYISIYCNETDICKIGCQSQNACTKLFLYCFGTCLVDCDTKRGM